MYTVSSGARPRIVRIGKKPKQKHSFLITALAGIIQGKLEQLTCAIRTNSLFLVLNDGLCRFIYCFIYDCGQLSDS